MNAGQTNFTLACNDGEDETYSNVTIRSVDVAGNETATNFGTVIVDIKIDSFTVSMLEDTKGQDTGVVGDQISSNGQINVTGVNDVETGSVWYFKYDGMNDWTLMNQGQTFFMLPTANGSENTFTNVSVKTVDIAGNESSQNFGTVTVDKRVDNFTVSLDVDTEGGTGTTVDQISSNGQSLLTNL